MARRLGQGFLFSILRAIVTALSPQLRDLLVEMIDRLYAMAKESPNPVDDVFVRVLADLLHIKVE